MAEEPKGSQYKNVTDLVDSLLRRAITLRASDIHFEPARDSFGVRFRIDGFLHPAEVFEKDGKDEIVSRIKVLAGMEIMEKRFPQDGHFEIYGEGGKIYNLRVSTFPTTFGEAVVLRLLDRKDAMMDLVGLGFEFDQIEDVKRMIVFPYGMSLITGPTGAGKTTLLYSILKAINTPRNNIVTIEDPIEFQMDTIRQLQVKESIGVTFPKALRAVLRQDPDVIMLGELRDTETVQLSFQAALSGILVFSTFHTFDVPGIIIRFLEMGIPRSVISHVLIGVVSGRLVRKICEKCKEPYVLNDFEKRIFGDSFSGISLKKGRGCNACENSGYLGREGVFEVVAFDEDIKSYIMEGKNISQLGTILRQKGSKSLWDAMMKKVSRGVTTVEETLRVIGIKDTRNSA
ncbi:MAG: GspE/PulE family protein [bacterium]|nr:GspE/PulE family protein [bacterium]